MNNIKLKQVIQQFKQNLIEFENVLDEIINEKEETLRSSVNIGDVVMKDYSIIKPNEVKDKLDEVFGVVFYVNGSDIRFMAIEKSEDSLMFKTENTSVSKRLPLYENIRDAKKDMNGKMNSEIIKDARDFTKEKYPSMGYCMDYNRFGFDKGKWYLPSIGELEQIYDSKAELNKTLKILGEEEITNGWYTSSSGSCANWSWWFGMYTGNVDNYYKNDFGSVYPCFSITINNY
jgi:hypothetical protein